MKSDTYKIKDSRLFKRFVAERDLAEDTSRKYIVCLNRYINYHDMTLEELIAEGLEDDRTKTPIERRLYDRMINFRTFMLQEDYSTNTINTTMGVIKTFYRQFRVQIPYIPSFKRRKSPNDLITLNDLPTIDDIRTAIENTRSIKRKAIILFQATNGTARKELSEFRYIQFLEGIREYCPNVETPNDIIRELDGRCEELEIVPIFRMYRFKTDEFYYTTTTPECVQFIINYLKLEGRDLKPEDRLFKMTENGVSAMYQQINNRMDWGKRGDINFFSSHRIRKFNASSIANMDLADIIQGRKPSKLKATYYKNNPKNIREDYKEHMYKFNIYANYEVMINSDAYKALQRQLQEEQERHQEDKQQYENELAQLRAENAALNSQMGNMEDRITIIAQGNNIKTIQDYIRGNDLVNEYNLSNKVIELYLSDAEENDVMIDNNYLETLVTRAYNHSLYDGDNEFINGEEYIEVDERYKELQTEIFGIYDSYMRGTNVQFSESQDKKITEKLEEYLMEIWKVKGTVDQGYVGGIIDDVALNG